MKEAQSASETSSASRILQKMNNVRIIIRKDYIKNIQTEKLRTMRTK